MVKPAKKTAFVSSEPNLINGLTVNGFSSEIGGNVNQ